jgi:hypothetical protein
MGWGHIAASCIAQHHSGGHNLQAKDLDQRKDSWPNGVKAMLSGSGWPRFGKAVMQDASGWLRPPVGPGLSSYYVPKSFLDLVKAWNPG